MRRSLITFVAGSVSVLVLLGVGALGVVGLGAFDVRASSPHSPLVAWAAHTTAGFDLRVFEGGHFFLTSRSAEVIALLSDHFAAALPAR